MRTPTARLVPLVLALLLGCMLAPIAARAQAPGGQEMCGDGSTFTVPLPGLVAGPGGSRLPDDSVTLPDGCLIYALLVSGYERNRGLDELTFYKLARFVAENDGYVHYAWWNNLLGAYMSRPLHDVQVTLPILGTVRSNPGGLLGLHGAGFVPREFSQVVDLVPKAIPEEDVQFQVDAERMIAAIRARNPDAIILVAGHSMGGAAVARLGSNTQEVIDLLAPIDPVGNRSRPVGRLTDHTFNWTRWRATRSFRGFKRADCVRNAIGLCRDFDSRPFRIEYRCVPGGVGSYLSRPPLIGSLAPGICAGPIADSGTRVRFRSNVRFLYHRMQREAVFPFDFLATELFQYHGAALPGIPAQQALGKNGPLESDPDKTCSNPLMDDPRDSTLRCNPGDGHGELVGFRGFAPQSGGPAPVGLTAQSWPTTPQGRRQALIEMATAPAPDPNKVSTDAPAWEHEPENPNLDLVVDDMIEIAQYLLDSLPQPADTTPPVTVATADPDSNAHGWNNQDVVVTLEAGDEPGGSGVAEVEYALSGAESDGAVQSGDTAHVILQAEGTTTITFFSRDHAGNVEVPNTLVVRIDRTPPSVDASQDPAPNANGWNRTDVTVTFHAEDALSGVDVVDDPVTVTGEGADQQVTGTATDRAGNAAAVVVSVSIDKTAPMLSGLPGADCTLWPPNHRMRQVATVDAVDALSGVDPGSWSVQGTSSEPEAGPGRGDRSPDVHIEGGNVYLRAERLGGGDGRLYAIAAQVRDLAGNSAMQAGTCAVPHDRREERSVRHGEVSALRGGSRPR